MQVCPPSVVKDDMEVPPSRSISSTAGPNALDAMNVASEMAEMVSEAVVDEVHAMLEPLLRGHEQSMRAMFEQFVERFAQEHFGEFTNKKSRPGSMHKRKNHPQQLRSLEDARAFELLQGVDELRVRTMENLPSISGGELIVRTMENLPVERHLDAKRFSSDPVQTPRVASKKNIAAGQLNFHPFLMPNQTGNDADTNTDTTSVRGEGTADERYGSSESDSAASHMSPATPQDCRKKAEHCDAQGQDLKHIVVHLKRSPGAKLGIKVEMHNDNILVTRIDADGLIEDWNTGNPDSQVCTGDRIVDVNGQTTPPLILREINQSCNLNITLTQLRPGIAQLMGLSDDKRGERAVSRRSGSMEVSEVTGLRLEREFELLDVLKNTYSQPSSSHQNDQVQDISPSDSLGRVERHIRSPWWLRICGVLPWEHSCMRAVPYRTAVLALGVLNIAASGANFLHTQKMLLCGQESCIQYRQLCEFVLAVGSFLALKVLHNADFIALLGQKDPHLLHYAKHAQIMNAWSHNTTRQSAIVVSIWAGSSALHGAIVWNDPQEVNISYQLLSLGVFMTAGAVFSGVTYAALHVSCALRLMIDSFSMKFFVDQDIAEGVCTWNILQAVLRKASRGVETALLVLTTTVLIILLLGMGSLFLQGSSDIWWLLSCGLLSLIVFLLFYKAAAVTEQCKRVVPLINSLACSGILDKKRQYLVEYVTYSDAGFYVWEVRLTVAMAMKLTYISCAAVLTLLTKLTSNSG